jgi:CRISPR-associated protein Cas10/Csm1 subtype III-A
LLYAIKGDVKKDDLLVNSEALLNELNEGLFENEYQQFNDIGQLLSKDTLRIQSNIQTCEYCGRDFDNQGDKTNKICQLCRNEKEIGTNVAKAKYLISIYNSTTPLDEAACIVSFFDKKAVYIFCKTKDDVLKYLKNIEQPVDVASINSTDYCPDVRGEHVSLSFITIGNAAPMQENMTREDIKELDDIRKEAAGAEYLAVVEMDSDNFGEVTSCARNDTGYALGNLSEVATLSSYFKYFSQAYLETKIEKHNGYTIYAGGDCFRSDGSGHFPKSDSIVEERRKCHG